MSNKQISFSLKLMVDGKESVVTAVTNTKQLQTALEGAKTSADKFRARRTNHRQPLRQSRARTNLRTQASRHHLHRSPRKSTQDGHRARRSPSKRRGIVILANAHTRTRQTFFTSEVLHSYTLPILSTDYQRVTKCIQGTFAYTLPTLLLALHGKN